MTHTKSAAGDWNANGGGTALSNGCNYEVVKQTFGGFNVIS